MTFFHIKIQKNPFSVAISIFPKISTFVEISIYLKNLNLLWKYPFFLKSPLFVEISIFPKISTFFGNIHLFEKSPFFRNIHIFENLHFWLKYPYVTYRYVRKFLFSFRKCSFRRKWLFLMKMCIHSRNT